MQSFLECYSEIQARHGAELKACMTFYKATATLSAWSDGLTNIKCFFFFETLNIWLLLF